MRYQTLITAALATFGAGAASATTLTSYSMPNGNTGSYTYWDDTYSGSGDVTVSNSALSGGTGDLTDGVIAGDNWFVTEAASRGRSLCRLDYRPRSSVSSSMPLPCSTR